MDKTSAAARAAIGLKFRPAPMAPKADPLRSMIAAQQARRLAAAQSGYNPVAKMLPNTPPIDDDFDAEGALAAAVTAQGAHDDLAGKRGKAARATALRERLWPATRK